jgi:hypothetical protein
MAASSAKVTCSEKCCFQFRKSYLFAVNVIDFGIACVLLSFSLYLWSKLGSSWSSPQTAWLLWTTAIISALLLAISSFSFASMASSSCRCLASFADYLAVLVALLDLAAGVAAFKLQRLVLSYLSDHRDSLKLTDGDISVIRSWYVVIAIGFFASLVLEAMRVWFNAGFSDTARRIDNEFSALLTEEDRKWEESSSERAQMTSEKYSALRAYYKKKYSRENRPSEDQQV